MSTTKEVKTRKPRVENNFDNLPPAAKRVVIARGTKSQSEFWNKFGATQSAGSRYESGRKVPKPLKLLMELFSSGKISVADLEAAKDSILEKEKQDKDALAKAQASAKRQATKKKKAETEAATSS